MAKFAFTVNNDSSWIILEGMAHAIVSEIMFHGSTLNLRLDLEHVLLELERRNGTVRGHRRIKRLRNFLEGKARMDRWKV